MSPPEEPLVSVRDLRKAFPVRGGLFSRVRRELRAVDGVSFDIAEGETLGLVGESGCGKSTLARCVARLTEPSSGSVAFAGQDISHRTMRQMRPLRRGMQLIFQDPMASLNPRKRVGAILRDALRIQGIAKSRQEERTRVLALLEQVGLSAAYADRLPRELSGGQRQRIGIARALALGPRFLVADEPVSALDVSVQAQILNLLKDLQEQLGLTMLFISHDLGVIRHVSDRIGVMYLGKLVELAPADAFYETPLHPYSKALLAAVPLPDPDARRQHGKSIEGDVPSQLDPPSGCRFHTRCPIAQDICARVEPVLQDHGGGRLAACHFATAGTMGGQAEGARPHVLG
jgi:oligopeptide/dipeptide ABC transporter ATP-binding protein